MEFILLGDLETRLKLQFVHQLKARALAVSIEGMVWKEVLDYFVGTEQEEEFRKLLEQSKELARQVRSTDKCPIILRFQVANNQLSIWGLIVIIDESHPD